MDPRLAPDRSGAGVRRGVPAGADWVPATVFFQSMLPDAIETLRRSGRFDRVAVAVSLLFASYVKGVTRPVVRRYCLDGRSIDPSAGNVRVRFDNGEIRAVAFASLPEDDGDGPDALPELVRRLLDENLAPAVSAVHAAAQLSTKALWGTVASALVTALRAVSWSQDDPASLVDTAREVLDADPRLRGLCAVGALPFSGREWLIHRRVTCCLRYRVRPLDRCAGCSRLSPQEQEARTLTMIARFARGRRPQRCQDLGCSV